MFAKGMSEGARKRVELAVAVAQEKLLAVHVEHALDLIALIDDDVSFTDALEIYARLLRLDENAAQNISSRALAILGEKVGHTASWPDPPAPEPRADDDRPVGRSFFGGLRHRLRGRMKEDLRRKIEFVAARTEVALINSHVDSALHFAGILKDEMEAQQAIELYLDALDVRESIAEVSYYLALARIADDILPEHGEGLAVARREAALRPEPETAPTRGHD